MRPSYDIIIFGAGTAGIVAAIQSGRLGIKTLLVEKQGISGGTLVTGGIPTPGGFHAYNRQIIAGIGWELCRSVLKNTGKNTPKIPDKIIEKDGGTLHLQVSPDIFAAIAEEKIAEAGVDILFHSMPATIKKKPDHWDIKICTKTGIQSFYCKNIIDCTGDANIVEMSGFELERNHETQAATLVVKASGYNAENLDYESIQENFNKEVTRGNMKNSDAGWQRGQFDFFLKSYGGNRIHIPNTPGRTSEEKSHIELEGRKTMLRILRFCRKQPGLENFTIDHCSPECGIRETVTINGEKKVTISDYENGRQYDDAVCYSFYMIAIHHDCSIESRKIKHGIFPKIPLGAMLPAKSEKIIVAGRCVSSDQQANSACRIQASCMAMGQVAGAAASLAVLQDTDIRNIKIQDLRKVLRDNGAIVPPDLDINKS